MPAPSAYASAQIVMRSSHLFGLALLLLAAIAAAPPLASQGPEPFARTFVNVSAIPGLVAFRLAPSGVSTGSNPVSVTTLWRLSRGNVLTLYAYFTNPPKALTSGGAGSIPSANVSGTDSSGTFRPFTGSGPFSTGGSLTIYQLRIQRGNRRGTRTDAVALKIDTTGLRLGPGVYGGMLVIHADAF